MVSREGKAREQKRRTGSEPGGLVSDRAEDSGLCLLSTISFVGVGYLGSVPVFHRPGRFRFGLQWGRFGLQSVASGFEGAGYFFSAALIILVMRSACSLGMGMVRWYWAMSQVSLERMRTPVPRVVPYLA